METHKVKNITVSIVAIVAIAVTALTLSYYISSGSAHSLSNRYLPQASSTEEIRVSTTDDFALKQWGYSNTGRQYSTLVINTKTNTDVVYYRISNDRFEWHVRGGKKHTLTTKGENASVVSSLVLDGEELNILPESVKVTNSGVGSLENATFLPNETFSGGTLRFSTHDYIINFIDNTVTAN